MFCSQSHHDTLPSSPKAKERKYNVCGNYKCCKPGTNCVYPSNHHINKRDASTNIVRTSNWRTTKRKFSRLENRFNHDYNAAHVSNIPEEALPFSRKNRWGNDNFTLVIFFLSLSTIPEGGFTTNDLKSKGITYYLIKKCLS